MDRPRLRQRPTGNGSALPQDPAEGGSPRRVDSLHSMRTLRQTPVARGSNEPVAKKGGPTALQAAMRVEPGGSAP